MKPIEERKLIIKNIPYFRIWANLLNFEGKQNRKDFFVDIILNIIVSILFVYLSIAINEIFNNTLLEIFMTLIYYFMGIYLSLSLIARRLNDAGIPWTYCFILLIPIFGASVVIMCFFKSRDAKDPKAATYKKRTFVTMGVATPTIILMFLIFAIVSLVFRPFDHSLEAKRDFMIYFDGKNDVALQDDNYLRFQEYTINLEKNLPKNEEYNGGQTIYNNYIYFTTVKNSYILNIYKVDLLGENAELVFSKNGYNTHPWAYGFEGGFYIEYYLKHAFDEDSKRIDKYDVATGIYENIDGGRNSSVNDYLDKEVTGDYKIEMTTNELSNKVSPKEHGYFVINDLKNNKKVIIDDDYLKSTIYYDSLYKYGYTPRRYNISNNHILLSYEINASDGLDYPFVVFEYNIDSDTFKYKLFALPTSRYFNYAVYVG